MDEPTGAAAEIEDLREAHLTVNDPFHTPGQGMTLVAFLGMWAAADALFSDPGEFSPEIPAALFLFLGFASAWARWNARKGDVAGFRRSLRRSHTLYGWVLPACRGICLAFPAVYGLIVWLRWERWKIVIDELKVGSEDLGGWGSLLFKGGDITLLILVVLLAWLGFLVVPRLRGVTSVHIELAPLDLRPMPDRHELHRP